MYTTKYTSLANNPRHGILVYCNALRKPCTSLKKRCASSDQLRTSGIFHLAAVTAS